jgi:L-alanine-DL-glutamate epimerase-like enolase superfamily enzyme
LLPTTIEIGDDGTIGPPSGPGLGVVPDFDALEQFRIG